MKSLINRYENDILHERLVIKNKIISLNDELSDEIEICEERLNFLVKKLNKTIDKNNSYLDNKRIVLQKQLEEYDPEVHLDLSNDLKDRIKKVLLKDLKDGFYG